MLFGHICKIQVRLEVLAKFHCDLNGLRNGSGNFFNQFRLTFLFAGGGVETYRRWDWLYMSNRDTMMRLMKAPHEKYMSCRGDWDLGGNVCVFSVLRKFSNASISFLFSK